ncbi:MAG: SRPBCC family protein [Chloroflexi bacterium]|nr:SRPBCC family protein [Chloroflexota bacterium]MYB21061.1 SRPBCC family protein [Chloroflexota bacterium]MYF80618.1 SRPBCC family protein [Chloroflexota bacterium]
MPIYRLDASQTLSTDIDTAWAFFSDPRNLAAITPPEMQFEITGDPPPDVHPGLIITYRLTPLPMLPLRVSWATEITQVDAPHYFADDQIAGPYALWRHEHRFREVDGSVLATDQVHWSLPLDPLSTPIAQLAVIPQLRRIFRYRAQVLRERFGNTDQLSATLNIRAL